MKDEHSIEQAKTTTATPYIIGFVSSVVITLTAYGLVQLHLKRAVLSYHWIVAGVAALAIVQYIVQLVFFLHLGREERPRWKLIVFACMSVALFILVAGSLWIMHNLNYRMSPEQTMKYMTSQDGL